MSKPIKERITDNIDKAKGEGKLRSENIRSIVTDAAALTATEIKEGAERMRTIVKDAVTSAMADIKDTGSELPEKVTHSIEHALEESTRYRKEAIASLQTKIHEIQAQIDERQRQMDRDLDETIVDIKTNEVDESSKLNEAIDNAVNNVKEREETTSLKQQYLDLKFQLANLDAKLAARYGDRYSEVKQQLEKVKLLYDNAKAEAEASGVTPIEAKRSEIERKISKFAASAVIAEQEIVKYMQDLWKNKGFDSKHK
jgi:vacuolar-type H+-ATPase subunit H